MKRVVIAALVLRMITSACTIAMKTGTSDGQECYFIDCGGLTSLCHNKAHEVCPYGYYLLSETLKTGTFYSGGYAFLKG